MGHTGIDVLQHYHCLEKIEPRNDGESASSFYFDIRRDLDVSHYVVRSEYFGPICATLSSDWPGSLHYVYLRTKNGFRQITVNTNQKEYLDFQREHLQKQFGRNIELDRKKRIIGFALCEFVLKYYDQETLGDPISVDSREDDALDSHTDVTLRVQAKAMESTQSAALHRRHILTEHIPLVAFSLMKIDPSEAFETDLICLDERKPIAEHCIDVFSSKIAEVEKSGAESSCHVVPSIAQLCPVPIYQFQRLILENKSVESWVKQQAPQVSIAPANRPFAFSVRELLETERVYCDKLRLLQEHWHIALKSSIFDIYRTSLPKQWINSPLMFVDQLLPSVAPLVTVHGKFLQQLEALSDLDKSPERVASYLLDLLNDATVASVYMDLLVCGVTAALKHQREYLRKPDACLHGFYLGTLKTHAKTVDPGDVYQMVQQRFTKYILLYREMEQHFDKYSPVTTVLSQLDSFLKRAESKRLQYFTSTSKALLLSSFRGMPQTILNNEFWVGRFDFVQSHHAKPSKLNHLSLILLNDCLMIGRPPPAITDPMSAQQYKRQIEASAQAFVTVTPGYMPDLFESSELVRIAELCDFKFVGRIDLQDVDVIDAGDCKILLVIRDPEDDLQSAALMGPSDTFSILSKSAAQVAKAASVLTAVRDGSSVAVEKYPSGPPGVAVLHLHAPSPSEKRRALRTLRWALTLSKKSEQDVLFFANEFANQDIYFRVHGPKEPETRSKIALLPADETTNVVSEEIEAMGVGYPTLGVINFSKAPQETSDSTENVDAVEPETSDNGVSEKQVPLCELALGRVAFQSTKNNVCFEPVYSSKDFFVRILGAQDWLQYNTQHYEFYETLSRDVLLHDIVVRYFDVRHSAVQDSLKRGVHQVINLSNQLSDTLSVWSRSESHYNAAGPGPRRSRLATIGSAFSTRAKSLFNVSAATSNALPPLPPLPAAVPMETKPLSVTAQNCGAPLASRKSKLRGILSSTKRRTDSSSVALIPPALPSNKYPYAGSSHAAPLPPPSRLDPGPALPAQPDASLKLIAVVSSFLEAKAAEEEGIYRRSGSVLEIDAIESLMLRSPEKIYDNSAILSEWDPLSVANALKRYMGSSGPARLPDTARKMLCQAYYVYLDRKSETRLASEIRRVWRTQIPDLHYKQAALAFISHLRRLCSVKGENRMNPGAIATSISQSFLGSKDGLSDFASSNATFKCMLEDFNYIFYSDSDEAVGSNSSLAAEASQETLRWSTASFAAITGSSNSLNVDSTLQKPAAVGDVDSSISLNAF